MIKIDSTNNIIQATLLDPSFYLTKKNISFNIIDTSYKDIQNIKNGTDYRTKHGLYIIYDKYMSCVWYLGIAADSDIRDRNIRHRRQAYGKSKDKVEAWQVASMWMKNKGYDYMSNVSITVIDTVASKIDLMGAENQLILSLNPLINDETFLLERFNNISY